MPGSTHSILLVEDDPELRTALAALLRREGYKVFPTEDSLQAITCAIREVPNVVILDLGLPGGGGYVVMERMRTSMKTQDIPILVLTGNPAESARTHALELGAAEFMRKPASMEALLAAVRRLASEERAA